MNSMHARDARSDEEGASATLFLVSLTALLAVTMLALDGGSLFVSRRGQIADTDAAALAVAQALADDPCLTQTEVNDVADDYITKNDPSTSRIGDIDVESTSGVTCPTTGIVTATTERDATMYFAGLFGYDRLPTGVTSGAAYGQVTAIDKLRPLGMCVDDPHYTQWQLAFAAQRAGSPWSASDWTLAEATALAAYKLARPDLFTPVAGTDFDLHPTAATAARTGTYPSDAHVHRLTFTDPSVADWCGGGPAGHFGWLDFDGDGGGDVDEDCTGISGNNELLCDIANGFQGTVQLASPADCDPTDDTEDRCLSQTGEVSSASSALNLITCDDVTKDWDDPDSGCVVSYIVVYSDDVSCTSGPGPGSSCAQFELTSVAGLVIRDYQVRSTLPGDPTNPNVNYLDVEFVDTLALGTIGPGAGNGTAPMGVALCVAGAYDRCERPASP